MSPSPRLLSIPDALEHIRTGRMVIVVDDEDRENEGDLTMAADLVTPEAINFMARQGRGLICLALTEERVAELRLPMMTDDNRSVRSTAFTVSIDARDGLTTGISARERAHTVRVAVATDSQPDALVTPGHVFPLRARRGGVLVRSGHTEAAIDLSRLAGRHPSGVICEIMRDDGEMARMPDLESFAEQHRLGIVRIADLIEYRLSKELLVRPVAQTKARLNLPGLTAEYRALVYTTEVENTEYFALVLGEPRPERPTLVRVQTANVPRDVFGLCSGSDDLGAAAWLRRIEDEGTGVLLYVMPGTPAAWRSGMEPASASSVPGAAPLRDFGLGAQVLAHLGVRRIRLLTNNPRRIAAVEGYGLEIVECVPSRPPAGVLVLSKESAP